MPGATPLPGYQALVNLAAGPSVGSTNLVLTDAGDHKTFTVPLASAQRYLDNTVAVVVQTECDEIQTVTITGAPTGGTFTLTFGGNTTTAIAYNAAASAVQSALTALASIGAGNASVSGSAGGPYTVEFIGAKADASQALLTAAASFTGGTSPGVTIGRAQAGQGWTTAAAGSYTLRYTTAQVVLATALQGTNLGCRLSAFNYLPYAPIVQAHDITFQGQRAMKDTTNFQGSTGQGWQSFTPILGGGTFACKTWQLNSGATIYLTHLTASDLLILSFVAPDGVHGMEAFCYVKDSNIQAAVMDVSQEDMNFQCTGQIAAL